MASKEAALPRFWPAGGYRNLWSGLSAVLAVSLPGSALFFVVYESARHFLERRMATAQHDKSIAMSRDAIAASVADVGACVVRVPCVPRVCGIDSTGLRRC